MGANGIRRIGILTGGGDCPGLNAVIRAVSKTAVLDYGWEVIGVADGFLGLIENRMRPLGAADVSNILTRGGTILGTSNKADPSRHPVGKDASGKLIFADVRDQAMENYRSAGLDAMVVIGGDGTMTCAASMIEMGARFVGVPKTIDNDLLHTDVTFGFQTAVEVATEAIDRLQTTAASHHRAMVVELMGRNAGWLTLHAGLAGGADIILLPEIPYELAKISDACMKRKARGKCSTIIAVSEGARPVDGEQVVDRTIADSPDPIRLGGIANVLHRQIETQTGIESRATMLGHVQRGGTPCAFDRVLATRFGHFAAGMVAAGEFNRLVVVNDSIMTHVSIMDVAGQQRRVPIHHPLIAAARSIGTSFGD